MHDVTPWVRSSWGQLRGAVWGPAALNFMGKDLNNLELRAVICKLWLGRGTSPYTSRGVQLRVQPSCITVGPLRPGRGGLRDLLVSFLGLWGHSPRVLKQLGKKISIRWALPEPFKANASSLLWRCGFLFFLFKHTIWKRLKYLLINSN